MDHCRMIDRLKDAGILFESGMTEDELNMAEDRFQFHFPKEIREFLSYAVPVGDHFFNYRDLSETNLARFKIFQKSIEENFRFDLANNRDDMLEMLSEKLGFAQNLESFDNAVMRYLNQSVKLIPFYAHRCFFDGLDDMPIVSFWQPCDAIFYGGTFENYLEVEFLDLPGHFENLESRMQCTGIWNEIVE